MALILRPRQARAIDDIRAAYRAGKNAPVLVAPTGFGKSATATVMIQAALAKGKRVWFVAHLKEILVSTSKALGRECIKHGWIASGQLADRRQHVQVVMVQTLANRLDRYEPPDLIIVDEAHLAVAATYQKVFEWCKAGPKFYAKGGTKLLHLTATPKRLDGRGLGEIADELIPTCGTGELIDEGLLAPIKYFAPAGIDLSGISTRAGDYAQDELAKAMNKPKITGDAVAEYRKVANNRPTVVFCVNIQHAKDVSAAFSAAGYRSVAISGDSEDTERDAALDGLQNGRLDIVCNCALWIAGVDCSAIACVIMLAPTKSLTKYLQSIGRGLRMHPGKDCLIVLDHASNLANHGSPTDAREWSLDATEKKKGKKKQEVTTKTCPQCFSTVLSAATFCSCGHEFIAQPREIETVEGELNAVDLDRSNFEAKQAAREQRMAQGRAQTLEDLIAIGRSRGMKRPELWSKAVLRGRAERDARRAA